MANVTISSNESDNDGGGIYVFDVETDSTTLKNTILAENRAGNYGNDCIGPIDSGGYNLLGDGDDCDFDSVRSDQVGTSASPIDPMLDVLADNGGPTQTHALQRTSPAIDAGNPMGCTTSGRFFITLTEDQRGYDRTEDGDGDGTATCDIGAFEKQDVELPMHYKEKT